MSPEFRRNADDLTMDVTYTLKEAPRQASEDVRNRQAPESEDDLPKLHLEFINNQFPVDKLLLES